MINLSSEPRKIKIVLGEGEEAVETTAILLEKEAPRTCKLIWDKLPIDDFRELTPPPKKRWIGKAVHHTWCGAGLFCLVEKIQGLECENHTIYPNIGDIGWNFLSYPDFDELSIVYGPALWRGPRGDLLFNVFARVTGNTEEFFDVIFDMRNTGSKRLIIRKA